MKREREGGEKEREGEIKFTGGRKRERKKEREITINLFVDGGHVSEFGWKSVVAGKLSNQ